ncbi:hypothetical protein [Streptomyces sp. NPDC001652]|uniref:hypothetical protein n=1 Tax=Streptomyces sp. NPDC001652 TaxID=3154393 RepID=UPI003327443A
MGKAKHSLGAAWREARKRTSDAVSAGMSRAEAADPERVRHLKDASARVKQRASEVGRTATQKRNDLTLRLAASTTGAIAGQKIAKMSGKMVAFPILSLPADVFNERHGINDLVQRLQKSPADAHANLVLAESLSRMQREVLALVAVRTVVTMSPLALMIREGMKTAGALTRGNDLPMIDKLLKRAYGLAMTQLRTCPGDPEALHIVARVYLAKRNPRGALKPALLGVAGRPSGKSGPIFYTLSRAYQALGDRENTRLSAEAAIEEECSLGWLPLSDLIFDNLEISTSADRHKAYVEALSHVSQEDLASYAGISPQTGDVVRSVYALQKSKALASYAHAGESVRVFQGKIAQRVSSTRFKRAALPSGPQTGASEDSVTELSAAEDSATAEAQQEQPNTRPHTEGVSDG